VNYINLKERYFLLKNLQKIQDHSSPEEQSLITSILGKIRFPDLVFTQAEHCFLKNLIASCLDDAMDRKDESHINFLSQLIKKLEQRRP
jgi:hypothetical protein